MYTEKELKAAAEIIRRIARENEVPEAQVRADIAEAIKAGRKEQDAVIQERWGTFRYAGDNPTAEEFILWCATLAREKLEADR